MTQPPDEHGLGDQSDAVLRAPETLGVEYRILADDQTIGDYDAGGSITTFRRRARPADLRIGQRDCLVDGRIGMRPHAGEQQRPRNRRPGNDAASRDQRRNGDAAPAVDVMDEFGGRGDLAIGPERPSAS